MPDIYMRIAMAVTGSDMVISAVRDIAKSLGGGGLGNALGNLAFGFRNLGTAGTIGTDALKAGFSSAGKIILETAAIAGVAITGMAVALGIKAVSAAGDFDAQTERLVTSAGELQSSLGMVRSGILQMSIDTATSTDQLTQAMYHVESSNYHAANGLQVLRAAAQGAKTENADLTTVSEALLGVLTNYHLPASQATSSMNGLIAVVKNGNTTLQDLSSSMSQVLPTAASLGISFAQVGGVIDTMTSKTMPARQAAQNLAHVLVALSAPSAVAVKSMQSVGLSAQQVKDTLANQGLPETLQLIEDAVGKKFPAGSVAYVTALKNIMGGLVGYKTAAQLTGASLKDTENNINAISGAMKNSGSAVDGFAQIQQTFNFKVDQAKQALGAFLIQLGTQLFPVFNQLMTVLMPIIQAFLHWIVSSGIIKTILQGLVNTLQFLVTVGTAVSTFLHQNAAAMEAVRVVMVILAFAIGVIMVGALYVWISTAIIAAAANIAAFWPVYLVVAAIVAIIALVVLAVTHWGQIVGWLKGVWGAIAGFFEGLWNGILAGLRAVGQFFIDIFTPVAHFFQETWNVIVTILTTAWNVIKMIAFVIFVIIVDAIILPFLPIIDFFRAHWAQIQAILVTAWNAIKALAIDAWGLIKQYIITPIEDVMGALQSAWNTISKVAIAAWNMLTKGIQIEWNRVVDVLQGPINTVMKVLDRAWTIIRTAAKIAWKNLTDDIGAIFGGVVSGIKWIINQVINVINGIIHGINNISSHVGIPAIPEIPHLASGGILTRGGLVEVGERGAETVALPAGSAVYPHGSVPAGAGGPMTIINISVSTMARSQSEVNRLVDMVEQEIGRRFRNQTSGYAVSNIF